MIDEYSDGVNFAGEGNLKGASHALLYLCRAMNTISEVPHGDSISRGLGALEHSPETSGRHACAKYRLGRRDCKGISPTSPRQYKIL